MKVDVECVSWKKLLQDFKFMKSIINVGMDV